MSQNREPRYIHPFILKQLEDILNAINAKLPPNHKAKMISAHRTPAEQFELFKKGRAFINGEWQIQRSNGKIVTNLDGFIKLSRHNYLPCTAIDIGLFEGNTYLEESDLYKHVAVGKEFGLDWGGDWVRFTDRPHLEIPLSAFFKKNIQKDIGLVWQKYLVKDGTYGGVLDGIFGTKSLEALKISTGEDDRTIKAWDLLFEKFGPGE